MFKRRIGPDPHAGNARSLATAGCPDIWELTNGDFAIIGCDMTEYLSNLLPPTASRGIEERIVVIPRGTLTKARNDIPSI
jgi:hypothetical protein